MMIPDLVTLTGPDDTTSVGDLIALSKGQDVEFGILFSHVRRGAGRYPSIANIERLRRESRTHGGRLRLSAHLCGAWARQVWTRGWTDVDFLLSGFERVQLNTAQPLGEDELTMIADWASGLSHSYGYEISPILQCRGSFPSDERVSWLFDTSGGRGQMPASWPDVPSMATRRVGYAGGISPDNVRDVLRVLPDGARGWIDMEQSLRDADDCFSIAACSAVLEKLN